MSGPSQPRGKGAFIASMAAVALASALVAALLINVFERKTEAQRADIRLVEIGEDDTDPAK
ncbi:MAG: ammonia-forming cytochrome c nitrite reductase subunit c552, partial [Candidatus Latescibacteria bacterium]|nr:ammonia-forming cytochrome c nitrite reductase subunit c552 [Candidatus Latescibacterota bacterium]